MLLLPEENAWTEKYRPTRLEDICMAPALRTFFHSYFQNSLGLMPNLLFIGPPGCGKTSLALALARHFFLEIQKLPAIPEKTIIALNAASLEEQLPLIGHDQLLYTLTHSCHPYFPHLMRFVIIDEAERLPLETQLYIRSIIQEQKQRQKADHPANRVRFLFMSNCEHELFEHLSALPIRLSPPSEETILQCLRRILRQEEKESAATAGRGDDDDNDDNALRRIAESCNRDLRRAIQDLQIYCGQTRRVAAAAEADGRIGGNTDENNKCCCGCSRRCVCV